MKPNRSTVWLFVLLCVFGIRTATSDEPLFAEATPSSTLAAARSEYQRGIEAVADDIEESAPQVAAAIRALYHAESKGRITFYLPPPLRQNQDVAARFAKQLDQQARSELADLRSDFAAALWDDALRQLEAARDEPARLAVAYRRMHEAAFIDPDHAEAQHVASAGLSRDWIHEAKPGRSRHKEFGWPGGTFWRVKSDHFLIVTNHSAAAASKAAFILEEAYALWRQMFAQLWLTPESLKRAVDGAQLPRARKPHRVVLFRDRAEYIRRLLRVEPNVEVSTGMYRDVAQTSYFYIDEPLRIDTWRHELTHQLFQEILRADTGVGDTGGFWAVEAVALFMESAGRNPGYYELGGVDSRRLQFARYRALNDQFYIPMRELAAMSKPALQTHPDIRRLYSQAAGIAHFLLDHRPSHNRPLVG